jgi:BASS family bile acid:Na+ symporter
MTVLGPTLAGVIVRHFAPGLAAKLEGPLGKVAMLLLLAGAGLLLAKAAPQMLALIGDGTLLAMALFVALALLVGHLIGGPDPGDRSVLALATACRHPAVAMTIAHMASPGEKAIPAAVLLYLIVSLLVTLPYVAWRKKAASHAPPLAATPAR